MEKIKFVTVPHVAVVDGKEIFSCMICGAEGKDLRFGVCFTCSNHCMSDNVYAWG